MPTANEISAQLVPKALAGDQQALADLWANIAPWIEIRMRAAKIPRCDREDLHREIEARIWRRLPQWDPELSAFSTWMTFPIGHAIEAYYNARRRWTIGDRLRSTGVATEENEGLEPEPPSSEGAANGTQLAYEHLDALVPLLLKLTPENASIVIDVHLRGMTIADVAKDRGVPYDRVQRRLSRAMLAMQRAAADRKLAG